MNGWASGQVDSWIPHRGAMRLIDRVLLADADHAVAEVDVPFDGLFVRDGEVPSWIGIEYMAQAVAAWAGARARARGGAPQAGLLLGSRRYEVRRNGFPSGARLRIEARCELMGDNGLGQFDCCIELQGEAVAFGRILVFDPPPGVDLLRPGADL